MNTVTITGTTLSVQRRLGQVVVVQAAFGHSPRLRAGRHIRPWGEQRAEGPPSTGLNLPGKWAGTFTRDGEKSFWNVSTPSETVVIELDGVDYQRLILTVDDPRGLVDRVNAAVQSS